MNEVKCVYCYALININPEETKESFVYDHNHEGYFCLQCWLDYEGYEEVVE